MSAEKDVAGSGGTTNGKMLPLRSAKPLPEPHWLATEWKTLAQRGPWLDEPPPPRDWLLTRHDKPVLARGIVGLLCAPGGHGKTFALCDLAIALATGRRWLDVFEVTKPGYVVLGLAEENDEEVRRRIHACGRARDLSSSERALASERIIPMGLMGRNVSTTSINGHDVTPTDVHIELMRLVSERGVAGVLLDPLSRWAPGIESDNALATRGVELFEAIAQAARATVLIAHHTGKTSRRDGNQAGAHASNSRGVTGLTDGVRWVGELLGASDEELEFVVSKRNGTPPVMPVPLRRDEHTGALFERDVSSAPRESEEERDAKANKKTDEKLEKLGRQILAALVRAPKPITSVGQLSALVTGKTTTVNSAVNRLIAQGRIEGGKGKAYRVVTERTETTTETEEEGVPA